MAMKWRARLQFAVLLSICTLVYLAWHLQSSHWIVSQTSWAIETASNSESSPSKRIVVFGDSWSTTDSDIVSLQAPGIPLDRQPDQGKLWVEVLCAELGCDQIDNYARSSPNGFSTPRGPVVSNAIFNQNTNGTDLTSPDSPNHLLPDLAMQIQDFKRAKYSRHASQGSWTVFTVYFGVWDIWHYATLNKANGMDAVEKSIWTIYNQLDVLINDTNVNTSETTIVMPKLLDSTWLPRWLTERTGVAGIDEFGLIQRQAVTLTDHWNRLMDQRIAKSPKGSKILSPDFNGWFLRQHREYREMKFGYKDLLSPGYHDQTFHEEFTAPCVNKSDTGLIQTRCQDARRHFFWDDVHIGGTAHEQLGKHVSELVKSSQSPGLWSNVSETRRDP